MKGISSPQLSSQKQSFTTQLVLALVNSENINPPKYFWTKRRIERRRIARANFAVFSKTKSIYKCKIR